MLHCVAQGDPPPKVFWLKDGHQVLTVNSHVQQFPNGSILISPTKANDTGEYRCLATNKFGVSEAGAAVTILTPPSFTIKPQDTLVENGSTLALDCSARGIPPPEQSWSKLGHVIMLASNRVALLTNGTLRIHMVNEADEGLYQCKSRSKAGVATANVQVKVKVAGGWSSWSPWGNCSSLCGGYRSRSRRCDSPAPRNNGLQCLGEASEVAPCLDCPASVNGGWSPWSLWSQCTVSCGGGTRSRSRLCNSPTPAFGGKPCQGNDIQTDFCNSNDCPVHGGWSDWSTWGECSATCGRRHRRRFRTCSNPEPSHGGRTCVGTDQDVKRCAPKPCPDLSNSGDMLGDKKALLELRAKPTAFADSVACSKGYVLRHGTCEDLNECLDDDRCQHKCENLQGSYRCTCPPGYRIAIDAYSCQDIDECEDDVNCGRNHICFNSRGSYQCMYAPCPDNYVRDTEGSSCRLSCGDEAACEPRAHFADVLTFKTVALPSGVTAGRDVVRLSARDHDSALLAHTLFTVLSNKRNVPFDVRVSKGVGIVFATEDLPAGFQYRITLHATTRDDANKTALFETRFFLFVSTSLYPY
ncbi:hemicentin-1 [Ixodes scapularis]|uniref:hemicentin-1 n=1 Tax=Ixodes scapularis TaxID=6945 RepID=UPI001C3854E5|nr:hemicentin-1 [Ixodes scapularis]